MGKNKKKLIDNFISLSLVQGLSILFPLITFPYLLRVLGVEGFGVFTLIQIFIMYFDMLVSFGFGLTATQHISKNIENPLKTQKIIAAVYIIKLILFGFSLIIFIACCPFIAYLRTHVLLVFISSLYLFGNLLFPDWYFQGVQKMRNITLVTLVSKSISLLLIILLVKHRGDIIYAVLALSAGNFLAGLLAFILLAQTKILHLVIPPKSFLVELFKESAYVFTSIIIAPLYSSINIFILQIFTNPLMVGYYAISEKIFSAIGMLTNIINRTVYPHFSYLYISSIESYKQNVKRLIVIFAISFFVFSIGVFIGAGNIVHLIAGKNYKDDLTYAIGILKIMSFALLFSPFTSFFFQLMIIQDQKREAIRNIIVVVCINLVSASILSYFFSGSGLAVNLCLIVMIISLLNFATFNRKMRILPYRYAAH